MAIQARSGRHFDRLSQIPTESGVFVYDGSSEAVEHNPTPIKIGKDEPALDADGMPALDDKGKQVFLRQGSYKIGTDGKPVLGGPMAEKRHKLDSRKIGGVEFKKGVQVKVTDPKLAQKLRCLEGFKEVDQAKVKADK